MTPLRPGLRSVFFNDTATTEIYTLSLHDALPICDRAHAEGAPAQGRELHPLRRQRRRDRKSTRLNSSHRCISYAVFCLKTRTKRVPASRPWERLVDCSTSLTAPSV